MSASPKRLIDPYAEEWLAAVDAWLMQRQASHPDCHIVALIDGAFCAETLLPWLQAELSSAQWLPLYHDLSQADERTLSISPQLVDIGAISAAQRSALVKMTDSKPMLSVMATPESLQEIAARLAPFRIISLQQQRYLLRFADTRLLPEVCAVWRDEEFQQFIGPTQAWYYIDRTAQWRRLPMRQPSEAMITFSPPVQFDEARWARLFKASTPDRLIDDMAPALYERWEKPSARHAWVKAQLQRPQAPTAFYDMLDFLKQQACQQPPSRS